MLRLLGYAFALRGPCVEKALSVDLAIGLMRAVVPLAERAARLPAGPSNAHCHGGMSFTTLRDTSPLPPGRAARRFFVERFAQLAEAGEALRTCGDPRALTAADQLTSLSKRVSRGFDVSAPAPKVSAGGQPGSASPQSPVSGIETARGEKMELLFETKRCIHARFCVTGAPDVFLANVQGPWIHPDAMEVERVVEVAHACPSGAIRYRRLDGVDDETAPPVNLAGVREAGPYAFRGQLQIDGGPQGFRATLCRCWLLSE